MIILKIVYLFIYSIEAVVTVFLIKKYGSKYESNVFARYLADKFSPNLLLFFPFFIGSMFVLLANSIWIFVILICFHGYFLLNHLLVIYASKTDAGDKYIRDQLN